MPRSAKTRRETVDIESAKKNLLKLEREAAKKALTLYTKILTQEELYQAKKNLIDKRLVNDGFKDYMNKKYEERLAINQDIDVRWFPGSV